MEKYRKISLSDEEAAAFKRHVTSDAPYANRVSLGFAIRLSLLGEESREDHNVFFEIGYLEQGLETSTKSAEQFKRKPLWPYWHKHFYTPRHMLRNIGERWNVARGDGNRDLDTMISEVAAKEGHDPQRWPMLLSHRLIMGALEERSAANRITGDWIIFAKYNGENYYLDLASHEEGECPEKLIEKIRSGSAHDFPFLFDDSFTAGT